MGVEGRQVEVVPLDVEAGGDVVADHLQPGHLLRGELGRVAGVTPEHPVLEALAHATGILAFKSDGARPDHQSMYYLVGVDNARFKRPVGPGDQLILEVRLQRIKRDIGKFVCEAKVDGQLAASADLMCAKRGIDL